MDYTPAQQALLGYMQWWSEECYCAGWLSNLDMAMIGDEAYDWLVEQAGGTFTDRDTFIAIDKSQHIKMLFRGDDKP